MYGSHAISHTQCRVNASTTQRSCKHVNAWEMSACADTLRSDSKRRCACVDMKGVEEAGEPDFVIAATGDTLPVRNGSCGYCAMSLVLQV